jgi:hypothetical protein
MLRGQDIVVLILLRLRPRQVWTYEVLSGMTGISRSQCHLAIQRLRASRLLVPTPENPWHVSLPNFNEFIVHALKYVFPAQIGSVTQGIPTAHSASFVIQNFAFKHLTQNAYVWPLREGSHQGSSLEPLHRCQLRFIPWMQPVPELYEDIYEMLVCIDLLRMEGKREQRWAAEWVRTLPH